MSNNYQVKVSSDVNNATYQSAMAIRQAVFVTEQGIDATLEFDGSDDDLQAFSWVIYDERGVAMATARTTITDKGVHIQRVATLKAYRNRGIAKQLLQTILTAKQFEDQPQFYLGAQVTAVGFYERLGFHKSGTPFQEVGIQHWLMVK